MKQCMESGSVGTVLTGNGTGNEGDILRGPRTNTNDREQLPKGEGNGCRDTMGQTPETPRTPVIFGVCT
jgi:hypothetical protein